MHCSIIKGGVPLLLRIDERLTKLEADLRFVQLLHARKKFLLEVKVAVGVLFARGEGFQSFTPNYVVAVVFLYADLHRLCCLENPEQIGFVGLPYCGDRQFRLHRQVALVQHYTTDDVLVGLVVAYALVSPVHLPVVVGFENGNGWARQLVCGWFHRLIDDYLFQTLDHMFDILWLLFAKAGHCVGQCLLEVSELLQLRLPTNESVRPKLLVELAA